MLFSKKFCPIWVVQTPKVIIDFNYVALPSTAFFGGKALIWIIRGTFVKFHRFDSESQLMLKCSKDGMD
jgi:hypothetical protein